MGQLGRRIPAAAEDHRQLGGGELRHPRQFGVRLPRPRAGRARGRVVGVRTELGQPQHQLRLVGGLHRLTRPRLGQLGGHLPVREELHWHSSDPRRPGHEQVEEVTGHRRLDVLDLLHTCGPTHGVRQGRRLDQHGCGVGSGRPRRRHSLQPPGADPGLGLVGDRQADACGSEERWGWGGLEAAAPRRTDGPTTRVRPRVRPRPRLHRTPAAAVGAAPGRRSPPRSRSPPPSPSGAARCPPADPDSAR